MLLLIILLHPRASTQYLHDSYMSKGAFDPPCIPPPGLSCLHQNSKFPTCWLRFPIPTRSPAVSLQRIHVRDDFCLDSSTGGALPRTCTPRVVQVGRCAAVGQKMDLWSTLGNGNSASSASWLFVLSASVLHLFCALCHLFRAFCTPSAPSAPIFHLGISAGLRRRIPAFPQPLPGGLLEGVACLSPGLSLLPPRMRRQVALSLIGRLRHRSRMDRREQ